MMRTAAISAIARAAPLLLLLAAMNGESGCGSNAATPTCKSDDDCQGNICVKGMCLPPPTGRIVAFEITPPSSSLSAATEILGVVLSGELLKLVAEDKAAIAGTVSSQRTLFVEQTAHVVVSIPSRIPGRTALQIGTEMAMNQFTFTVPKGRVGPDTPASFLFIPGTTAQTEPPVPLEASLTSPLALTFPTSDEMIAVSGQLVDQMGRPFAGDQYPARITFNSAKISNVLATDTSGFFTVLVPPHATPAAPADPVTLTIGTADNTANIPEFVTMPVPLAALASDPKNPSPKIFAMPDFEAATMVSALVTSEGKGQAGVMVRFRTEILAPPFGSAVYERSAVSDDNGVVVLPLIPGTAAVPRLYQISVQPPPDPKFRFASLCLADVPLALSDAGQVVPLPELTLHPKLELSGSVSDSTAAPVSGARVTATQIAPATACPSADAPSPAVATTEMTGNYSLLVDPGTYRIEVEPAATSAWPRLVQDGASAVTVSHATVHPIALPAGEVVQGVVMASDQTLLPGAGIVILQVFCSSAPCEEAAPPVVLAQTQTDMNGNFRAVLAVP